MTNSVLPLLNRCSSSEDRIRSSRNSFDFQTLYANGYLRSNGYTDTVFCCEDAGEVEVEWLGDASGQLVPWRCCPYCGAKKIAPEELQTWKVNFPVLLERVSFALGLDTPREEIPSVLYYMGTKWGCPIYYLRSINGVWRRNVEKIVHQPTAVLLLNREQQRFFYAEYYDRPTLLLESFDLEFHGTSITADRSLFEEKLTNLGLGQNLPAPQYRFVKKSGWYIKYDKTETFLPGDLIGLEYIQQLLKYPGQEIHVTEFLAELTGKPESKAAFGSQEKADPQMKEEYKSRLQQIVEERRQAQADNDEALLDRLNQEVETIGSRLMEIRDFCGKKATFADDVKKMRRRISKKIKEALEMIRESDPALFTHLDHAITTGSMLRYAPEDQLGWVFI